MQIGAQLYTLRDYVTTEAGFIDALARCKAMGYAGVQISAVGCMNGENPEVDAKRARTLLDDHGLICCATHRPLGGLIENVQFEIDFHLTLGCSVVGISGVFDSGDEMPGYESFVNSAFKISDAFRPVGLKFAYHNHSHEFIREPNSKQTFFDYIATAGPKDLQFILDTYWVVNAGVDCADMMRNLRGRIDVVHAKDREVVSKSGPVMAPVGEGLMNWDAILLAASESGTRWMVVEQDVCLRDPFDCLRSSYDFLAARISG